MITGTGFQRIFLIFANEDGGYEAGQKPSGYVKIETRDGKGKGSLTIQNLRPGSGRFLYRLYLIKNAADWKAVAAGELAVGLNRTELDWSFDPLNVGGSGAAIGEFDIAAVLAEHPGNASDRVICPLAAYKGKKTEWRNEFRSWMKQNRMDKAVTALQEYSVKPSRAIPDRQEPVQPREAPAPQLFYPQVNYPQAAYPQELHPQANYPQANYPQDNKMQEHGKMPMQLELEPEVQPGVESELEIQKVYPLKDFDAQITWKSESQKENPEEYQKVNPEEYQKENPEEYQKVNPEEYQKENPEEYQKENPEEYQKENLEEYQQENPEEYQKENPEEYQKENPEEYQQVNPEEYQQVNPEEYLKVNPEVYQKENLKEYQQEYPEEYQQGAVEAENVQEPGKKQAMPYQPVSDHIDTGCVYLNGNMCNAFVNNGSSAVNPCTACHMHHGRSSFTEPPAGDVVLLREELDRYFEQCDPFHSHRSDYTWWRVGNPVNLNNLLYQCNIRSPLLFNPAVMMAHYKYRHLIVGIFLHRARDRYYVVCGVPGMSMVDKKPFGDMSRWVQAEGNRPRYGAFGYWLVYIDPDGGKILDVSQS